MGSEEDEARAPLLDHSGCGQNRGPGREPGAESPEPGFWLLADSEDLGYFGSWLCKRWEGKGFGLVGEVVTGLQAIQRKGFYAASH